MRHSPIPPPLLDYLPTYHHDHDTGTDMSHGKAHTTKLKRSSISREGRNEFI